LAARTRSLPPLDSRGLGADVEDFSQARLVLASNSIFGFLWET
jgi:hypothetical protein